MGGGGEPGRNTDILHSSPLHHKIIISFSYSYHIFFIFFTAPRVRGHILFIFFSYYWSYFFHISEIWPKPSRVDGRLGATPAASPEPGVIHCQGLGLGSGRPFSAWAANRSGCKHNGICNQEYQNPSENNDLHSKSQNPRKKHAISTQGGQNLCETNTGALESARFMIKKRHLQGCQSHCKDKCICRKDSRILVKSGGASTQECQNL